MTLKGSSSDPSSAFRAADWISNCKCVKPFLTNVYVEVLQVNWSQRTSWALFSDRPTAEMLWLNFFHIGRMCLFACAAYLTWGSRTTLNARRQIMGRSICRIMRTHTCVGLSACLDSPVIFSQMGSRGASHRGKHLRGRCFFCQLIAQLW